MKYNSKLSIYKPKKIIECFCIDIEATKTVLLLGFNRNTINLGLLFLGKKSMSINPVKSVYYTVKLNWMKALLVQKDNKTFTANNKRFGTLKHNLSLVSLSEMSESILKIMPDCTKATLQAVIIGKVSVDGVIYSDIMGLLVLVAIGIFVSITQTTNPSMVDAIYSPNYKSNTIL